MNNYFYKKNNAGDVIETWQYIHNINELQIGEWIFYACDRYFGRVISNQSQVQIHIEHFRDNTVAYQAKIKSLDKLLRPINNIYIDWQIAENFNDAYKALEKAFRIWKKIESYILDTSKENREKITPPVFFTNGRIFGKWSSTGYLNHEDLESLRKQRFCEAIAQWIPLEKVIDYETDETLIYIDRLQAISYEEACSDSKINICNWLAVKSGHFIQEN
ncbi:hypothetical protein [Candidatus Uabimicrobium sp. HlEnr_7]|uniref:hypothetical protein n=1 Tax=Candidatus Uabimicrobium helgolandensis TaxID=3095367 RepID=UPI003557D5D1